jgi:hypothetical protein
MNEQPPTKSKSSAGKPPKKPAGPTLPIEPPFDVRPPKKK